MALSRLSLIKLLELVSAFRSILWRSTFDFLCDSNEQLFVLTFLAIYASRLFFVCFVGLTALLVYRLHPSIQHTHKTKPYYFSIWQWAENKGRRAINFIDAECLEPLAAVCRVVRKNTARVEARKINLFLLGKAWVILHIFLLDSLVRRVIKKCCGWRVRKCRPTEDYL